MAKTISGKVLEEARAARAAERAAQGNDARTTSPIWVFPNDLEVVIQFLVDPTDLDSITQYREVYCPEYKHVSGTWSAGPFEGRPRAEIPFGMRDVVIEDWDVHPSTGRPIYLNIDKIDLRGQEVDLISQILDGSSMRYGVDDDGNPRPQWRLMIDAIIHHWPDSKNTKGNDRKHPQAGDHVLLKFRDTDWKERLVPVFKSRKEEGDDLTAFKWGIKLGKADRAANQNRTATIVKRGAAEPVEVELFDTGSELDANRKEFIGYTNAVYADFIGEVAAPIVEEQGPPPEWATKETATEAVNYDLMSAAAIKKLLTAAGVEYPEKVTRPKLLALAHANLT